MKQNKKITFNHLIKWLLIGSVMLLSACNSQEEPSKRMPSPSTSPLPSSTPSKTPQPTKTPSPKEKEKPTGQAVATTTIYDNLPHRNQNLRLAIDAIHKTIINPEEEFSFNQAVGPRTKERGYQEAIGYDENGEKTPTIGGGICQISSTIYMAALKGNYTILERHSHSHKVPYADSDHDATVSYGGYDFRFQNNRDKPIQILIDTDGQSVTAKIMEVS